MVNTTDYTTILKQVALHTAYRQQCLNLIASENIMSPAASALLSSDLANRYSVGRPYARWFPGFEYYDKVEDLAEELSRKLFHVNYANVQSPTGMVANMAAYTALLKPNDLVLSLSVKHSGHYSHVAENIFSKLQIRVESLPFDEMAYSIEVEKAIQLIKEKRPQMIILGTSEFLFPAPVKELRAICDETNTKILYDASHVSGLVAGQTFQNPMVEGAAVLTMSTNKTLAAPSHGIVACNDTEQFQTKIEQSVIPLLTSNHHAHHVAALALTLAEFEMFGHDYASQVIKNAKALARALYAEGVAVLCPEKDFTESHTVLIDTITSSKEAVALLAEANIMTNSFQLPWNSDNFESGVRVGTNELTRLNMKEEDMKNIAQLIAAVLLKRMPIEVVRKRVVELRKNYQQVHYCFDGENWL
jgi:glycine hydroxymethyltransferase